MAEITPEIRERDLLFAEMRKHSPHVTGGILQARQASYEDGPVLGKYKLLAALAISVAIRCAPCIQAYVKMAMTRGATIDEVIEFLNVAMTMQGCPGEEWALVAYAAAKDFVASGMASGTQESCCTDH